MHKELVMQDILRVSDFSGGYGDGLILKDITFSVRSDEIVAVAGPNGCGKSSLVKGICNLLPVQTGTIQVLGKEFHQLGRKGFARLVAVVPQEMAYHFHFTVEELVMMGRIPHIPRFKPRSGHDFEIVDQALHQMNLIEYRHRMIHTLSGGEKQRVSIAQALAQRPSLLILDEPTAFLDLNHQMEIMELLLELNINHGISIILTSHDLNLASLYGTRLMIMKNGNFVCDGRPSEVISVDLLKEVYGVDSVVITHPENDTPHLILRKKSHHRTGNGHVPD
jgi:iron complex transport system ATP-binding protein